MAIMQEQSSEQRELGALLHILQGNIVQRNPRIHDLVESFNNTAFQLLAKVQDEAVESLAGAGLGTLQRERLMVYVKRLVISEWNAIAPLIDHFLRPTPDFEDTSSGIPVRVSLVGSGQLAGWNASPPGGILAAAVGKMMMLAKAILSTPLGVGESAFGSPDRIDIAIILTDTFSLRFIPYFRGAFILTVPIYTLSKMQERHILWHELASIFIQRERVQHLARRYDEASYLPHVIFPSLGSPAPGIDWSALSLDTEPDAAVYAGAKAASRPDAGDRGWDVFWMYWAHALHGTTTDLELHARPTRESLEKLNYLEDWRVGHLEELIEDACAALVFRSDQYATLRDMFYLYAHDELYRPDLRHPAPALRLGVTVHLLRQMGEDARLDEAANGYAQLPGAEALASWIYANRDTFFNETASAQVEITTFFSMLDHALKALHSMVGQQGEVSIPEIENLDVSEWSAEQYIWTCFSYLDPNSTTPKPPTVNPVKPPKF